MSAGVEKGKGVRAAIAKEMFDQVSGVNIVLSIVVVVMTIIIGVVCDLVIIIIIFAHQSLLMQHPTRIFYIKPSACTVERDVPSASGASGRALLQDEKTGSDERWQKRWLQEDNRRTSPGHSIISSSSNSNSSSSNASILISSITPSSIVSLSKTTITVCSFPFLSLVSSAPCSHASIGGFVAGITCEVMKSSCEEAGSSSSGGSSSSSGGGGGGSSSSSSSAMCSCVTMNITNSALLVYAIENMR
jgi:uncharacterized membrane protein YgcG